MRLLGRRRGGGRGRGIAARGNLPDVFWVRTKVISAGCAVLNRENKNDDCPDEWNQANQQPPAAATGVMESADRYGKGWNQNGQRINNRQKSQPGGGVYGHKHNAYDEVEQAKKPIFLSPGPSAEHRVLL